MNKIVQIQIVGHADSEGEEEKNLRLSQERADRMSGLLIAAGVRKAMVNAVGVGTKEPLRPETDEANKQFNRSASFKVSLLEPQPERERR